MKIRYTKDGNEARAAQAVTGFFEGWPNPPSAETHLTILRKSYPKFRG